MINDTARKVYGLSEDAYRTISIMYWWGATALVIGFSHLFGWGGATTAGGISIMLWSLVKAHKA